MDSSPNILMCPPKYYGIEYEINPWMNCDRGADPHQAADQWEALRQLLLDCGARIELVDPVEGLPDMVFTANAALIYRQLAVLSQFRFPQRQGEQAHWRTALAARGYRIEWPPEAIAFEGAGDALSVLLGDHQHGHVGHGLAEDREELAGEIRAPPFMVNGIEVVVVETIPMVLSDLVSGEPPKGHARVLHFAALLADDLAFA